MAVARKVRRGGPRTAKQKSALRKAQLASARKRKGRGRKRSNPQSLRHQVKGELRRRKAIRRTGRYEGKGAIHRNISDYYHSRHYYKNNLRGKRVSKVRRGYRKVNTVAAHTSPLVSVAHAVSYRRHKKQTRHR